MLDSIFRGVFDSASAAPIYIRQADKAFITLEGENFLTNGGTFIGTGSSLMAQTFSDNTQGIIAVSLGGSAHAGTEMVSGHSDSITVGAASGEFEAY